MKLARSFYLTLLVAFLTPTASFSQTQTSPQQSQIDPQLGFIGSGMSVEASNDKTNVALAFGQRWDDAEGDDYTDNNIIVKFSTPITSKENSLGQFVTTSGLADTASIELAITRRHWKSVNDVTKLAERANLVEIGLRKCEADAKTDEEKQACRPALHQEKIARRYLTRLQLDELDSYSRRNSPLYLYGASASVGFDDFDFRDPVSLEESDVTRTSYGISAYLGVAPKDAPLYFGAGVEHKITYTDQDEQTFCRNQTTTPVECFTGAFDEPKKNTDSSIFTVIRGQTALKINNVIDWPIGVEAKVAYDFEDDVLGIGVPVYFIPNSDGGLQAGVRLDWEDKDDRDVVLGIFVSSKFGIFGTP